MPPHPYWPAPGPRTASHRLSYCAVQAWSSSRFVTLPPEGGRVPLQVKLRYSLALDMSERCNASTASCLQCLHTSALAWTSFLCFGFGQGAFGRDDTDTKYTWS